MFGLAQLIFIFSAVTFMLVCRAIFMSRMLKVEPEYIFGSEIWVFFKASVICMTGSLIYIYNANIHH